MRVRVEVRVDDDDEPYQEVLIYECLVFVRFYDDDNNDEQRDGQAS